MHEQDLIITLNWQTNIHQNQSIDLNRQSGCKNT